MELGLNEKVALITGINGGIGAAVKVATDAFGRLDILVNNAGATTYADFFTLTDEDFHDGFAHNQQRTFGPADRTQVAKHFYRAV
jgi:NAD(P)-dependent dehydrogenase (short-subunit alcohol dehydrogenase family)